MSPNRISSPRVDRSVEEYNPSGVELSFPFASLTVLCDLLIVDKISQSGCERDRQAGAIM